MTSRRRRTVARRQSTSRHFLLSHAHTRRLEEPLDYGAERIRESLARSFPGVLCGGEFREHALQRLEGRESFAALAVRPDERTDQEMPPSGPDALEGIAGCLDETCRATDGFWGVDEAGMIAGLWPGIGAEKCLEHAAALQQRVRAATGGTVTVGVAAYPSIDFPTREILENARKAADHAAFFGPGSRAAFDAVSLNISGDKFYERGNLPAAVHEFQQALKLDPLNVNARNSLGVCYGVIGDYEQALAHFQEVVRLESGEHMAVYNIGLIHALLGRRDRAREFFLKAGALRGDVFEILFQTGKLYLDSGDPQSARPHLEKAAGMRSRSGNAQRLLGDCLSALGKADEAMAAYRKAVKANPGDAAALSALGSVLDEKGENPEIALVFCKESVRRAPENPLFRCRLAGVYLKMSRLEEAVAEYEQAMRLGHDTSGEIQRIRSRMEEKN
jgi:tetratricopeptide (TPR) repeat protein